MMIDNDDEGNLNYSFVRSHRAPRTFPKIDIVTVVAWLGVALVILTGVTINAHLDIL
jgi:hypothetical protein